MNGVELMLNFKKIYPNYTEYTLDKTYRNSINICDIGNKIAKNIDNSEINTSKTHNGNVVIIEPFESQRDEAKYVSTMAIKKFKEGSTVRILYRTNAQSLTFQQIMLQENIPFSINQDTSIFSTKEFKVAIACCKLFLWNKNLTLEQEVYAIKDLSPLFINKFELYALTKKIQEINLSCIDSPNEFTVDANTERALMELFHIGRKFQNINTISGVFNHVANMCADNDAFSSNAEDNLMGVSEFAIECKNMSDFNELIDKISRPRLLSKGDRAISLSTIHASKGLEDDVVYVSFLLLPHPKSLEYKDEINLAYVAVTRAKNELYISTSKTFGSKRVRLSPYFDML